jgi:hypothetical protein
MRAIPEYLRVTFAVFADTRECKNGLSIALSRSVATKSQSRYSAHPLNDFGGGSDFQPSGSHTHTLLACVDEPFHLW